MDEVAELLQCTTSRIWTLLYRAETLRSISEDESFKLYHGGADAMVLYADAVRDKSAYWNSLTFALVDGPELPFIKEGETHLDYLLRQTESIVKAPGGRPLWRRYVPQQRPRKGKPPKERVVRDPLTQQTIHLMLVALDARMHNNAHT
jgi:hypothetical protein